MTQKEAVIKALEILGGKGELRYITLIALNLPDVDWSGATEPEANIRRIVRNTPLHIKALGKAQYSLVSYQNEIDVYKATIESQRKEIEDLQKVETASHFIIRFLNGIKKMLKHETKALDEIRKLFISLGFETEAERLDNMIEQSKPNITITGDNTEVIGTKVCEGATNIEEIKNVKNLYERL